MWYSHRSWTGSSSLQSSSWQFPGPSLVYATIPLLTRSAGGAQIHKRCLGPTTLLQSSSCLSLPPWWAYDNCVLYASGNPGMSAFCRDVSIYMYLFSTVESFKFVGKQILLVRGDIISWVTREDNSYLILFTNYGKNYLSYIFFASKQYSSNSYA